MSNLLLFNSLPSYSIIPNSHIAANLQTDSFSLHLNSNKEIVMREIIEEINLLESDVRFTSYTDYDATELTYEELLKIDEWQELRKQVLKESNYTCAICNSSETLKRWDSLERRWKYFEVTIPNNCRKYKNTFEINGEVDSFYILDERDIIFREVEKHIHFQVHHRYYIEGRLPWDYHPKCFLTLCVDCHINLHKKSAVPYMIWNDGKLISWTKKIACDRCNGAGVLKEYNHVQGGICFKCRGRRYLIK